MQNRQNFIGLRKRLAGFLVAENCLNGIKSLLDILNSVHEGQSQTPAGGLPPPAPAFQCVASVYTPLGGRHAVTLHRPRRRGSIPITLARSPMVVSEIT